MNMLMDDDDYTVYLQRMFWVVIGAVIAFAAAINILNKIIFVQRIYQAKTNKEPPARPKSLLFSTIATATAVLREIANVSFAGILFGKWTFRSLSLGRVSLILSNLVIVLVFCFWKLNTKDQWQWEDVGYQTGHIALVQLPLIFLLSGKRNIIGFLVGSSYERLNYLHRWLSRILFLTVTIHMGFWFRDWDRYDYIKVKLTTDAITKRGFAAWCILIWITFSSFAPIRRWNYEFFVIQHLATFIGFLVAVYLHIPSDHKLWVWIPLGLYIFDRCVRTLFAFWTNFIVPNILQRGSRNARPTWGCKASLTPLCNDTTRITVLDPPIGWKPGQHVFLSCHSILPLQSHPFTIASIPADGKMEFLVRAHGGGTKRLFNRALNRTSLPSTTEDLYPTTNVALEGPYGCMRSLHQFDSVIFLAGSTGATFTMPLMRDIVQAWKTKYDSEKDGPASLRSLFTSSSKNATCTRYIRFVWVIKTRAQLEWFVDQLTEVIKVVKDVWRPLKTGYDPKVSIDISVYITCDTTFTSELKPKSSSPLHYSQVREVIPPTSSSSTSSKPINYSDEKHQQQLEKHANFQDDKIYDTGTISIGSVASAAANNNNSLGRHACGPDETCCCTTTISDDDQISPASLRECHCSPYTPPSQPPPKYSKEQEPEPETPKISIPILTGRPDITSLICKTLEQALGESAVVACGPRALIDDARNACVVLSDERAVHKGTGAQGIWFWGEGFGY
ncbi:MAG: hypothetical protein M1834_003475 [Cirrosporium novae-zelandiae]|nr:MAG: hypothetical protein M1834_003475 [Cirrosporium novae-zelandiae]